jgi:hypothetical protein
MPQLNKGIYRRTQTVPHRAIRVPSVEYSHTTMLQQCTRSAMRRRLGSPAQGILGEPARPPVMSALQPIPDCSSYSTPLSRPQPWAGGRTYLSIIEDTLSTPDCRLNLLYPAACQTPGMHQSVERAVKQESFLQAVIREWASAVCQRIPSLSGLCCLCKGEANIGAGRPGPPILNIWVVIVGG